MSQRIVAYLISLVLILQANAATIGMVLGGYSVMLSPVAYATDSDTPLLDKLQQTHNLNNPDRNHQNGTLSEKIVDQMNPQSNDLSEPLQRMLNEANSSTTTYDFSGYHNNDSSDTILQQQRREALAIGNSHGTPDVSDQGAINLEYARDGTRNMRRDENGELIVEIKEDASDIERVQGVSKKDLVSSEVESNEHIFDTPDGYGDAEAVRENVKNSHGVYKTGSTSTARAYQTITEEIERGINTRIDPDSALLQPSKNVINEVNNNQGDYYQACTSTTNTEQREMSFPAYDEYSCQTTNTDNPFFCEVERELRIPMIVSGDGWSSCGVGCYEFEMGDPDTNNMWDPAGCQVYSLSKSFTLNLTDGIELDRVSVSGHVDDHVEFLVDGKLAYSVVDHTDDGSSSSTHSYTEGLPGSGFDACEAGSDIHLGRHSIGGNKTFGFKRHFTEDAVNSYEVKANVLVGGEGEFYAKLQFQFKDTTGKGFGEVETQYPEGCKDKVSSQILEAGGLDELYSQGLTDDDIEYSFCRYNAPLVLEEGSRGFTPEYLDPLGPMFPGDTGNKTWKYSMTGYACDPLGGKEYCIIDPESLEQVCYDWEDLREMPDHCESYRQDNTCEEVRRECTTTGWFDGEIGYDDDGEVVENEDYCFNETVTFRCESNTTVNYETDVTTNSCDSALPCSGGECNLGVDERNEKFVEAAVMANVIQNVDGDRTCEDPTDPSTCRIFEGEAEYCSWEVTGLGTDCCESPGGINILAYVSAANGMLKVNRMAADGVFGDMAKEGAQAAIDFADDAVAYVSEPITNVYSSIVGNAAGKAAGKTAGAAATEGAISSVVSEIEQQVMKYAYEAMPDELANLLFDATIDEATGQASEVALNETVGSIINFVGGAYTVYSMVKLALQLLTMCDENESDMGVKIAQRQCFKVEGSYCSKEVLGLCYQKRQDYCCYDSILARIIMEQAGPLLGKDMSNCQGLTQQDFGKLDFDQIDLSEWVGLLFESGEIKTEADEQSLTGGGEMVATECETFEEVDPVTGVVTTREECFKQMEGGRILNAPDRQTVSERTQDRIQEGSDWAESANNEAVEKANNLDCSVVPRPPVCDFGIDVTDSGN